MTLGRTGADTVTHIVSIVALAAVGLGYPAILALTNSIPSNVDTTAHSAVVATICLVEITVAVMMAYYSARYQQSGTGVVIETTSGENSGALVNPVVGVSPDGKTTVVIPAGYII